MPMVISRTPLRITFTGGGTDLPAYYREYGPGVVISAAIDKFITIIVNDKFDKRIRVSYSKTEIVEDPSQLNHELVREALKLVGIDGGIEIVSISDIPSEGTGLGSSSAFTVGLLNALHVWKGERPSPKQLAEEAIDIELNRVQSPVGKQDQYLAAFGGMQYMSFEKDERVVTTPLLTNINDAKQLRSYLMLFYTGRSRQANPILKSQSTGVGSRIEAYRKMIGITEELREVVLAKRWDEIGLLMHKNWELKKTLSNGISDPQIDEWYRKAMSAGATGGKLIGAGGGGFLLMFSPPEAKDRIRVALKELEEKDFEIQMEGSHIHVPW